MAARQILSDIGYYDLKPGKLATVVTSLEMLTKPDIPHTASRIDANLDAWSPADPASYRALFRHVGENWLWCSRLLMTDDELSVIVNDVQVDVYAVMQNGMAGGLLELDYRQPMTCEISYFGLGSELIGQGVGGWLMCQAIKHAWSHDIQRLWVHTCTLDHPGALGFYQHFGFKPFKQQIEIIDDPRLHGTLPRTAAPQIPMITQNSNMEH